MGYVKTAMLMAEMTALFMGVGYLIGGSGGALIALVVAAGMNAFTWWNSDRMVLKMHNAQPVSPNDRTGLYALTAELARNAGLPEPKVYLIDTPQPNAFATGRNPANAAVAVTKGLMQSLSREELAGVIAHELAHIRNHDTAIMTVTATFAGAISMLANFALFFGGAPPWPPHWCRWRSAGRGNMRRTRPGQRSAATRSGWPQRLRKSRWAPRGSTITPPSGTRPRRICSSSTRCTRINMTASLPHTRRRKTASQPCVR